MSESVLLISDLHLEPNRPDITAALKHFLEKHRGQCSALYILGDLFEVWIGDDALSDLALEIAQELDKFARGGSDVFIMHGNRDFLIGDDYAQRCGASLIQEPFVLKTDKCEILLLHGDHLCTDDVDYQNFRAMVRNPAWQSEFLNKTIEERVSYAQEARKQSQAATGEKPAEIMDVNQAAVANLFNETQQTLIIHGHTHRPAVHEHTLSHSNSSLTVGKRIVLGDWDKKLWYVQVSDGKTSLHSTPF